MSGLKFSKDHEWIRLEGEEGVIGISDYAQQQLGDIVFVELPEVGRAVEPGAELAVIESVKAASEIYAPVSGTVTATNEDLVTRPELVNSDATGEGWFVRLKLANPGDLDALMDEEAYAAFVAGQG